MGMRTIRGPIHEVSGAYYRAKVTDIDGGLRTGPQSSQ